MSNPRLTIDLVPRTSWTNNVRKILTAAQWKSLRDTVCDAAYNLCQICGGVGSKHPTECHEIWDYNEKTLVQKLTGMISLCPACHQVKHFGLAEVQGKAEQAFKHLMKINKWNKKEAEAHVKQSFEIWTIRNRHRWTLDLSLLKAYGIDPDKLNITIEIK